MFWLVASEIKPLRNIKLIFAFRKSSCGPGCHKKNPEHLKTLERKIYLSCSHLSTPVRVTALPEDFIPQNFQLSSAVAAQKSNYCAAFPNSPETGNSVSVPPVNLGPNPKPNDSINSSLLQQTQWAPCEHREHTWMCLTHPAFPPRCRCWNVRLLFINTFLPEHFIEEKILWLLNRLKEPQHNAESQLSSHRTCTDNLWMGSSQLI